MYVQTFIAELKRISARPAGAFKVCSRRKFFSSSAVQCTDCFRRPGLHLFVCPNGRRGRTRTDGHFANSWLYGTKARPSGNAFHFMAVWNFELVLISLSLDSHFQKGGTFMTALVSSLVAFASPPPTKKCLSLLDVEKREAATTPFTN